MLGQNHSHKDTERIGFEPLTNILNVMKKLVAGSGFEPLTSRL